MANNPYNNDGTNFTNGQPGQAPPVRPGQQQGGILYSDPGAAGKTNQGFRNRNSFGGVEGGADQNVNRYRGMGYDAGNRSAYDANYGQSDQSRGVEMGSLAMLQARAQGSAPSAAEISGRNAMGQALNNSVALAGGTRGGAMQQAAAMRGAGNQMAGQQANMTAGIQAGRANEMAVASGQLMQGAEGVRGQDLGQTQQQIQNEQFQRQLNQGGQQFYEGLGYNVNAAQLAANQQAQAELTNEWQAERGQTVSDEASTWNRGMQVAQLSAGAASGGAGAALGAAAAAHGGPVHGQAPYLVGEQGPELVVPKKDGYVMTAQQTAALLGAPPTEQQRQYLATRARAFGGPIGGSTGGPIAGPTKNNLNDPGGESAGELGLAGVGGLVKGTIAHENRDVEGVLHPMMRALGGPMDKETYEPGGDPTGSMALSPGGGSLDVMGSLRKTNAIDTQYLHHAGYAREEGGPVWAERAQDAIADHAMRLMPDHTPEGGINLANVPDTGKQPRGASVEKNAISGGVRGKREEGGPVKGSAKKHAAHKAGEVVAAMGTPYALSGGPAVVEMAQRAPAKVLSAQGDSAAEKRAMEIASAMPASAAAAPATEQVEARPGLVSSIGDYVARALAERRRAAVAAEADAAYRARPAAYVAAPKREVEVYTAPAVPSMAPAGSGPVMASEKYSPVPVAHGGFAYPGEKGDPEMLARACGGPVYARAEGGPMLGDYLEKQRANAGNPYEPSQESRIGIHGAPRGYAAGREGQAGYMFGDAPAATHGYEPMSASDYGGLAPGSDDFDRYGASAKFQGDPDWNRGGMTTPAPSSPTAKTEQRSAQAGASGGNWISRMLLGINGGIGGSTAMPSYGRKAQ